MGWNMTLFTWAVILVSILTGGDPVCPILDGVWQIKEGGDSPTSLELKSQGNRTNPTKNRKPVLLQPVRTISSPDPSSSPWFSTVWPIILSSTWAEITNRRTPHKLKHYSICQFVVFWISWATHHPPGPRFPQTWSNFEDWKSIQIHPHRLQNVPAYMKPTAHGSMD